MGADWPENRNHRRGPDFLDVLMVFVIIILALAWVAGVILIVHGAFTKDLWEFIYGVAMIIVLWIIRTIMKA